MNLQHGTELEVDVLEEVGTDKANKLVLFNDEVNTFDFVIDSLIDVCGHDPIQAEQCTLLVHYTGKCAVKEGQFKVLEPLCTSLLDRGLSAEIH
jgi:ATP-dependent Clp protease adaptor protein ClpS